MKKSIKITLMLSIGLPTLFVVAGVTAGFCEAIFSVATDANVHQAFKAKFERMASRD